MVGTLVEAARRDSAIGIVGNRQLTPGTELLNHAGVVFDRYADPIHVYRGKKSNFPPALVSREYQIVTAACLLVKKKLFHELDGFDLKFINGHEDADFCLRAHRRGHKVYYAADSLIYHYERSTSGRTDNEAANHRYFKDKWKGLIFPDIHYYYSDSDGSLTRADLPDPCYPFHLGDRFKYIESLKQRRPVTGSILQTCVRLSTSIAKRLNATERKEMERSNYQYSDFKWQGLVAPEMHRYYYTNDGDIVRTDFQILPIHFTGPKE